MNGMSIHSEALRLCPNLLTNAMENLGKTSVAFIIIYELLKKKRRRRTGWSSQLYVFKEVEIGAFLLHDIQGDGDGRRFKKFTRMSESDFSFLLNAIKDKISTRDTHFRRTIPGEERLVLTL